MCGRFTLTATDLVDVARAWAAEVDAAIASAWRPRFNVAPADAHPVLVVEGGKRRLVASAFGVRGPGGRLVVNARAETAAEKPLFRDAWSGARCAVPADGFFEWEGPRGRRSARRPIWLHPASGAPILLAAVRGEAPGGGSGFAIVTTAANGEVSPLHDRMPLVVPPAALAAWLEGPPPNLAAAPDGTFLLRPVSERVNKVANDDPACLAPPEDRQVRLL